MFGGLIFVLGLIVSASLIYLTPLKWITVIEPTVTDITPADFYAEYKGNEDQYIFIDVRGEDSYNRLHAAGAINMPLHTLYNERHNLPKKGKKIVLICSGALASGVAFSYLQHYGFFNIVRVEGGIEAWQLEGLPVESNI